MRASVRRNSDTFLIRGMRFGSPETVGTRRQTRESNTGKVSRGIAFS